MPTLSAEAATLDTQQRQIEAMYDNQQQRFLCEVCGRPYKTANGLQRHLENQHQWNITANTGVNLPQHDHIAVYSASFMKCALLLRDTNNAYQMGDGDRILLNTKFQMLLSRVGNHTKYQLWLFRFMAYCYALLTPKMAYEYLWNCTTNLQGNTGHNIPNDNLVELLVQAVKKKIHTQGSNATYRSARNAAMTLQIQEELMVNMQKEVDKKKAGQRRPAPSKLNDILAMVNELMSANIFGNIPGREFSSFPGFKDVYSRVKVTDLHKWLSDHKQRLSYECI